MKKLIILLLLLSFGFSVEKMTRKETGQLRLETETVTSLTLADTYYPVSGNFVDGNNKGFSLANDGTLTHLGGQNSVLLNGVSDIQVDKVCTVTYALFLNGVLVDFAQTPHSFTAASKTESIAITGILISAQGDYYQIYAKSSESSTNLTVTNLFVTFWGR